MHGGVEGFSSSCVPEKGRGQRERGAGGMERQGDGRKHDYPSDEHGNGEPNADEGPSFVPVDKGARVSVEPNKMGSGARAYRCSSSR